MDDIEIGGERGRLHPRVGGGETAADIDDVDRDRSFDDRCAHALERRGVGVRGHRLAADVKADAKCIGRLACRDEKVGDVIGLRAEFGGEAELRMIRRDADAHQQVEITRAFGGAHDLFQLVHRVEREGANAMLPIGFGNGFLRLHRMHEAQHRLWQGAGNEAHFGDRGDVIMRHTRIPKDAQQVRRRIRLDCVERFSRKMVGEETGCPARRVRTHEGDGFNRLQVAY
jgi:hypothetical protein